MGTRNHMRSVDRQRELGTYEEYRDVLTRMTIRGMLRKHMARELGFSLSKVNLMCQVLNITKRDLYFHSRVSRS